MRRLGREERVSFEGEYYRTERATIYDRPEVPVPIYVAAFRRPRRAPCRAPRRRLHLHQRQSKGALHRDAAASGRRGPRQGRPGRRQHRVHDRDEGVLRSRPPASARGHAALGGARALAGGEDRHRGSGRTWKGSRMPCRSSGQRGAGSCPAIPTSTSSVCRDRRSRLHAPDLPRPDQRRFLDLYAAQVLPRLRARYGAPGAGPAAAAGSASWTRRWPQSRARSRTDGTFY